MKIRYLLLLIPICLACSRQPFDLSTQRDSEQMDSKGETRSVFRDAGADCFLFPVVKDWSLFSSYADRVSFFQIPDTVLSGFRLTPDRTVVPNTYDLPELLTSSDKSLEAYRMHTFYPHCSVVSEATTTYNCHFYAFHRSFKMQLVHPCLLLVPQANNIS